MVLNFWTIKTKRFIDFSIAVTPFDYFYIQSVLPFDNLFLSFFVLLLWLNFTEFFIFNCLLDTVRLCRVVGHDLIII